MPLNNIHEWVDDEVITHDDLNSIGEAVSQAVGSGNITPTQLTWPLVAQGDIDMNGYTIRNLDALSGVIHVNDEKTLAEAVLEVVTGGTIIIDPGATATASASDIVLDSKSNITIMGYGGTEIAVGGSVTNAGIKITNSCSRIKFIGLRFTGGTTGKPAVHLDGGSDCTIEDCYFSTPIGVTIGSVSNIVYLANIARNTFNTCTIAIRLYSVSISNFEENKFVSCTRGIHIPGDSDGSAFSRNKFRGNLFTDVLADGSIYGLWTGTVSSDRGNNLFDGNVFNVHVSNKAFDVSGYYKNTYSGNECGCPVSIKGSYSKITGNIFEQDVTIDGIYCLFDNNVCYEDFTVANAATGLQRVMLTNSTFFKNIALDNKIEWYNGNIFHVAPTISSGDAYTGKPNWPLT